MTRYRDIRIVVVLASLVAVPAIAHGREWTKLLTSGDIPSVPAVAALGRSIYLFGGVRDHFATFENTFFDDLHPFYTKTNLDQALPGGDRPAARTFAASAPAGPSCATAQCAPA
ncbi:MAG: hypothetical protein M3495_21030 [Pseudomonadota bacterium]|nr:hypothetical protein [Gammaproteobacteria bacterium]MDQ3583923.1 hypothetical protein [Pseudomonadota bacterium]